MAPRKKTSKTKSKSSKTAAESERWTAKWLDTVTPQSMTQRKLKSIERKGGSLRRVVKAAKRRSIHLVLLTDDRGVELVAASHSPFKTLC